MNFTHIEVKTASGAASSSIGPPPRGPTSRGRGRATGSGSGVPRSRRGRGFPGDGRRGGRRGSPGGMRKPSSLKSLLRFEGRDFHASRRVLSDAFGDDRLHGRPDRCVGRNGRGTVSAAVGGSTVDAVSWLAGSSPHRVLPHRFLRPSPLLAPLAPANSRRSGGGRRIPPRRRLPMAS